MVFALAGGRLWVTTARGSVKARAWRADPRVGGLVRAGDLDVVFGGAVTTFDLLDPESWGRSIRESPLIAVAAARFTRKNARFFAGYAVDAHQVPLAWTPPGRVFAELGIERSALLQGGRVVSAWGRWGDTVSGSERFRAARAGRGPLDGVPAEVRDDLGERGDGVLAMGTVDGPLALPARWAVDGSAVYAAMLAETLALADPGVAPPVALEIDHPSWWRARAMVGAMIRGEGEIAVAGSVSSGERSLERVASLAGVEPSEAALVRVRARDVVWWRGWSSGTVRTR
jgi:hypothetical protein